MNFGERISAILNERDLQPVDIWKPAKLSPSLISNVLHGRSNSVRPDALYAIADALGVSARWLATGKGPKEPSGPIDADVLVQIYKDVSEAVEASSAGWEAERRLSLACDLYNLYAEEGEVPNPGLAVRILARQ